MRLIGITGKAGSGKDTAADYLVREHGYRKYALAGPLKAMLRAIDVPCDTQEEKAAINPVFGVTNRYLAQSLGTEWMRECVAEDGWLRLARQYIETQRELSRLSEDGSPRGVVVADIRYDNEAEMIKKMGGTILKINRRTEDIAGSHVSETGISPIYIDWVYDNDKSVDALFFAVQTILNCR